MLEGEGDPAGPELVLKPAGTWVRGASLPSCFSFLNVAAFVVAAIPSHEGNGAPSPLFRAFGLVNVKFCALFPSPRWRVVWEKARVILID